MEPAASIGGVVRLPLLKPPKASASMAEDLRSGLIFPDGCGMQA